MMRTILQSILTLILASVITVLTGCQPQVPVFVTQFAWSTNTPFQPVIPTATLTPQPTHTPAETPTPFPTETPMPEPTQTNPPEPSVVTELPTEEVAAGEVTVPILLYHHISDTIDTQYNVHPDRFAEQMKWLHEQGYSTITIADVARLIREGGELPGRPVVLTFDDGYLDVFKNAFPIMQQYGFVGTFFIIGETIDVTQNLSTKNLKKLIKNGWEIGSHSMTHIDLKQGNSWEFEIIGSKNLLEEKLGVPIVTFAYPYGLADAAVIRYTIDAGYTSAVGLGSNVTHNANTLYFLNRKEVKSWYGLDFFEDFMPWTD